MIYTLYNQGNKKALRHPKFGIWQGSLNEAKEMLQSCQEYLNDTTLEHIRNNIKIVPISFLNDRESQQ